MYKFKSKIVLWPGEGGAWHFSFLPKEMSGKLKKKYGRRNAWSSIPVSVTTGKTTWRTSIFFDRRSDTYLLPLKVDVRKREALFDGESASFKLGIRK